ncbi:MAG: hypothetical protein Q8L10_00650 [Candidatus Moranbacteria bacterium]|nr:hypothetical protein [Candidatus Moranbacteria bacterium]
MSLNNEEFSKAAELEAALKDYLNKGGDYHETIHRIIRHSDPGKICTDVTIILAAQNEENRKELTELIIEVAMDLYMGKSNPDVPYDGNGTQLIFLLTDQNQHSLDKLEAEYIIKNNLDR